MILKKNIAGTAIQRILPYTKTMDDILPPQEEGASIQAESTIEQRTTEDAQDAFKVVKQRLLQVNGWDTLAGKPLAHFRLYNTEAQPLEGEAQKGNLIRIDIPGPGNVAGDGYDWVIIEELICDEDMVSMTVRPWYNPLRTSDKKAHFYDEKSTSTFLAHQSGTVIKAGIYDRNIKENEQADTIADKIRDKVTAAIGKLFFSKIQWQLLADGFVKEL